MAKAPITEKHSLSASGILAITDECVAIEIAETGELVDLRVLLSNFADKTVKIKVDYDFEYEAKVD